MRPHRRARALFYEEHSPGAGGCEDPWSGCHTPPPVPSTPDFGPGPSPALPPQGIPPSPWYPPVYPPSPAPAHNGRRDQGGGMHGNWPPPPPGVGGGGGAGDHRRDFVRYALIAAGVIAFVSLILLGVSVAVRRRQVRRRRQALLLAPSLNAGGAANADDDWGGGAGGAGGGVVHHVWNIRTVGLDEASIGSIAVTRYRAGAGLLGAADCSVCLGEFQDGELVRLLPKCAHAFHVPCIDTWLRAHVNCPVCRSDVLDPAVTAAADSGGGDGTESVGSNSSPPPDPDANANAAADQAVGAASDAAPDHEEEESDGRDAASPAEAEDQREQSGSAEPPPPRNVRRAASMDAVAASTAADVAELDRPPEEAPPEEEQIGGRRKRWIGPSRAKASGSGHWSNLTTVTDRLAPSSGGVPRSFFSRHCRARSSVLPL